MSACIRIAQELIRFPSFNPPGEEASCIGYLANLLEQAGLAVQTYEFAPGRPSLVAALGGTSNAPPLCFTGHVDVVPLGTNPWTRAPFAGDVEDGKLYGRGSSDMKAGIAAFVAAVLEIARKPLARGITLAITAGEETGCEGAFDLVKRGALGTACLLIVAEPSSNEVILAHKGSLRLAVTARGRTAHSSMPHLGDNAIYLAADWIGRLKTLDFEQTHPLLGGTTLCVTTVHGGLNINSVPDAATFTVDVRSIPGLSHDDIRRSIGAAMGPQAEMTPLIDVPGFSTRADDPAIRPVLTAYEKILGRTPTPRGAPYFTDASALTHGLGGVPTVVIGPGDMEQAHQTDEYCRIDRLEQAFELYRHAISAVCTG
jgi:succinyl-diaminopimelate desuccinylase